MHDSSARPWGWWDDVYRALSGGSQNMKLATAVEARDLPAFVYQLHTGVSGDEHNPSVLVRDGRLWANVRVLDKTTYYTTNVLGEIIDRRLTYKEPGDGPNAPRIEGPIVLKDETCGVTSRGHEDCRLFMYNGLFAISATVCNKDQTVGFSRPRLTVSTVGRGIIVPSVPFASTRQEKNWMPCVDGDVLKFVYSVDPLIVLTFEGGEVTPRATALPEISGTIRGGSQLIRYGDGWLAVVHQVHKEAGIVYTHRFAVFDRALTSVRLGAPFYFLKRGIEFCAGLAEFDGKFILSFGLDDKQAFIAEVTRETVEEFLKGADLPAAVTAPSPVPDLPSPATALIDPITPATAKFVSAPEVIDVFITHYIPAVGWCGLNEIVTDQVVRMQASTEVKYRCTIVLHSEAGAPGEAHLRSILPPGVFVVSNDRTGRPDILPSLRNKALDLACGAGSTIAVMLHNDVRPAKGWLEALLFDLEDGEDRYGRGNVIVSPRYVPYHYIEPALKTDALFWQTVFNSPHIRSAEQMVPWSRLHGFEFNGELTCPHWKPAPPHGHQLMMWITRPEFFDAVGPCDENFTGVDYDDVDWGMRALIAGKKSLLSQTALMGHIEGLTFSLLPRGRNTEVFIAKWGKDVFDEMRRGDIWERLRCLERTGPLDVIDLFALATSGLEVTSIVDVGTGRNGVVGFEHWDRLPGLKFAVDIFDVKPMPKTWTVLKADARMLLNALGPKSVDVVQACDFIEHLTKEDALKMLSDFERIAKKAVLLFTPNGFVDSPAELSEPENLYQKHLCGFTVEELEALGYTTAGRIEMNVQKEGIVAWKILAG